jgi:hypothetical protein
MKVDQADESPARMEATFAYYDKRRTKSLANALSASSDGFRIVNASMNHTRSELLNSCSFSKPTISGTDMHMRESL